MDLERYAEKVGDLLGSDVVVEIDPNNDTDRAVFNDIAAMQREALAP